MAPRIFSVNVLAPSMSSVHSSYFALHPTGGKYLLKKYLTVALSVMVNIELSILEQKINYSLITAFEKSVEWFLICIFMIKSH